MYNPIIAALCLICDCKPFEDQGTKHPKSHLFNNTLGHSIFILMADTNVQASDDLKVAIQQDSTAADVGKDTKDSDKPPHVQEKEVRKELTTTGLIALFVVCMSGWSYGYDLIITGGVIGMTSFQNAFFPDLDIEEATSPWCEYSNADLQLVVSAAYIAAVVVTFPCIWASNKYPRHHLLLLGSGCYTIGSVLETCSPDGWLAMLIVGRVFVGTGMAICNQIAPTYCNEISPIEIRGRTITAFPIGTTFAILAGSFINYGTSTMETGGWRISFGLLAVPAILMFVCSFFLCDSPTALAQRGKPTEEVERAFNKLRKDDFYSIRVQQTLEAEVETFTLSQSSLGLDVDTDEKPSRKKLFIAFMKKVKHYRMYLLTCFFLGASRSLTGNPLFLFYAPELFQIIGMSVEDSELYTSLAVGVAQCAGTIVALLVVDRYGRRPPTLIGGLFMLFSNIAAAIMLGIGFSSSPISESLGDAVIFIVALFEFWVCVSILSTSWLISQEICPPEARAAGAGMHVIGDLGFQVLFSQLLLTMLCAMEWGVFVLSAFFCVLMLLFVWLWVVETNLKTLPQIQRELNKKWLWRKYA